MDNLKRCPAGADSSKLNPSMPEPWEAGGSPSISTFSANASGAVSVVAGVAGTRKRYLEVTRICPIR